MSMETFYAVNAMRRYGGNFTKRLAELWVAADSANRQTIETAFPGYFAKYAQIAQLEES